MKKMGVLYMILMPFPLTYIFQSYLGFKQEICNGTSFVVGIGNIEMVRELTEPLRMGIGKRQGKIDLYYRVEEASE